MNNAPFTTPDSFADLVLNQPRRTGPLVPTAYFDREGDCVEFFTSDEDFRAERKDDRITLYRGRISGVFIGGRIEEILNVRD